MRAEIKISRAQGTAKAPPSKSYAHRLLMCAALAKGVSIIRGVGESEDISAMLDCIKALGAKYRRNGDTVTVEGFYSSPSKNYNCRESGNTLRFIIPTATMLTGEASFKGAERLIERGIGIYEEVFKDKIAFSVGRDTVTAKGSVSSGNYKVRGNVSSQFVSGLLYMLPLLNGDSTLELIPPVESRSYIEMTVKALSLFGIVINREGENKYLIQGGQTYNPCEAQVEGDWSNGAFLYALNYLGGDVVVTGLNSDSLQGDRVCVEMLEKLSKGFSEIDLSDCPDLAPVLFAVAAAKHGGHFTGTKRLKIKESDRAEVMVQELSKFGVSLTVEENSVTVDPKGFTAPTETLFGHNDHRIVMALSVLCTVTGGTIDGIEAVNKTYPDFFERISELGIEVKL